MVRRWIGLAVVALTLVGCESVSPDSVFPEPVRQVAVEHGALAAVAVPRSGSVRMGMFTDERAIKDKSRIGELHGPVVVPVVGGEGAAPFAILQVLALANPVPTGNFVTLKNAPDLSVLMAGSIRDALGQAGYKVDATAAPALEGSIAEFWLRPSWTVTCDIRIELRLVDANGSVYWKKMLDARSEKFIGLWTEADFAAVIRTAMNSLLNRAAEEFANEEFAVQVAGR